MPAPFTRRHWLAVPVAVAPLAGALAVLAASGIIGLPAVIALTAASLAGLGLAGLMLRRQEMAPDRRIVGYLMGGLDGAEPPNRLPQPWSDAVARLADEREAHRSLVETGRLQQTVIDSSPNAVVVSDRNGRVVSLNPSAVRLFRIDKADLPRIRMSDLLVTPAASPSAKTLEGNILATLGEKVVVDGQRRDGRPFPAEMSIYRVGTGEKTLFAAYIRDLTAEREAHAAREAHQQRMHQSEKLSAMGSLLAGVAHELNNPLAILVTQATLLREKASTPDVERRAERIHAAAQRAGRIIKSFLAMARQKTPVREPIQLNDVMETALDLVGYGLRSAGITVERALDPALPVVEADRDLMGQVFANLLLNAQQALTDRGEDRRITVASYRRDGRAVVEIADNGAGVADDIRDRIFDPYFTTKPAGAATGIGLSICRTVVAAHDGQIEAVADRDAGALFRVSLPCVADAPAARIDPTVGGSGLSILVVDDEVDVADALAELLGIFGHRAVVRSSAIDALDRIRQQRFDAVFTDLRMPGMNGLSLRQAIKALDGRLADNTVIMTGDTVGGPQADRTAEAAGERLVLEKPFTADDVRKVLAEVCAS